MIFTEQQKESLKKELVGCLEAEEEIKRIVVFGSFINSVNPHDIDVAIFQDSNEKYLPLTIKYRKKNRTVSRKIPLDIFPFKFGKPVGFFLSDIEQGEVIYER